MRKSHSIDVASLWSAKTLVRAFALSGFSFFSILSVSALSVADVIEVHAPEPPEVVTGEATTPTEADSDSDFSMNYVNIFYGPSVQRPSALQPSDTGNPDPTRPVFMKNFLSLGYTLGEYTAVTGTAYWQYIAAQGLVLQDPFVRVSHAQIIHTDWGLNLYSDARVHFGVTSASRNSDMITGLQNFDYLSWEVDQSRLTLALRASARYNVFGPQGQGLDLDLYLAPELTYKLASNFALTALYEMGASHEYGDPISSIFSDGTDFEPGFAWDITSDLTVNPYLNILTSGKISLAATSVGMFLSWTMF